jgi:hypothetical protein
MSKVEDPLEPKAGARETPSEPASERADPRAALSDLDEELFAALNFRIASGEIDPQKTTLHAFEAERLEKRRIQEAEDNARAERARATRSKAAAMQQEFGDLQRQLKTVQAAKAESEQALTARTTELAELKNRLAARDYEAGKLREENQRLKAQLTDGEKRVTALQAALVAQPPLPSYENENRPPPAAADSAGEQAARLSRRLAEAESILTAAQSRLRQVEGNVAKVNTERARIALAREDERRMQELIEQRTQFESVQERVKDTESVLAAARKFLQPRAEPMRMPEFHTGAPAFKRDAIEERLAELDAELSKRLSAPKAMEQAPLPAQRAAPQPRSSEQAALARAADTNGAVSERIGRLEAALVAEKEDAAAAIEEIKAALRREKMERLATEGALETARRDFARLMRTALALQPETAAEKPDAQEPGAPSRDARAA